jgi:hypothetical protein
VDLKAWETVEVHNGVQLVVFASPTRHQEVGSTLNVLRRLAGVAVVVNARLYEVDRTFYTRKVAPLFARYKKPAQRPRLIAIDGPLLRQITRQKPLLESEDVKLTPHQDAVFLSRQSAFRFAAGPRRMGTGVAGVSFEVRPLVSADRRFLRLTITQRATQLVSIDRTTTLDIGTGKAVGRELPHLRKTSTTGTVEVPDGNPILMPVEYRPPGKDKVWLLVARPFIWIEEEVKELRKQGGDLTSKAIWNADVQKVEDEKGRFDLDP